MALGSCRRWCPAPAMIRRSAAPWTPATTRASSGGTISSSPPWTSRRSRGARADTDRSADRSRSAPDHRLKSGGESDMVRRPASRACRSSRRGLAAQSDQSAGAASAPTPLIPSSTAAAQMANAAPLPNPTTHTLSTPAWLRRSAAAATTSSRQPSRLKSPSDPGIPRRYGTMATHPISVAIRKANSGKVATEFAPPSGPLGNPWQITTPGRAAPPDPDPLLIGRVT